MRLTAASSTAWALLCDASGGAHASVIVLIRSLPKPSSIPQEESAAKRMRVVPPTATRRHLVHLVDVAAADDDIVEFKG
jgi:hypothetical protein